MKTDEWFDQKDEVIELRPENNLSGVRDVTVRRDGEWFRVRISIGDYMYFDSPLVLLPETAKAIVDSIKSRLF